MTLTAVRSLGIVNTIRSSLVGVWVGILPGVGGSIGSIISYSMAKNFSRHPEAFGSGAPEGIVASESSNNAAIGGALIPLLSLGIPGSLLAAILLGAFTIHGITPGPMLFASENIELVYSIIWGFLISNILMFLLMVVLIRPLTSLVRIPKNFLFPAILLFCVLGTFALNNRVFDVIVMVVFAIIGTLFIIAKIPLAPFIIGLILAPIAETNIRTALTISQGSILPMFTRPLSLSFLIVSALSFAYPLYRTWKSTANEKRNRR